MPGEVTRLGFRLDPQFLDLFRIDDPQGLVGAEFPVTWGEHEARGKVIGVHIGPDAAERGVLVTMEVSAAADFPAFLKY
jgi:hypothetical protein